MRAVYLDNNATTRAAPEVVAANAARLLTEDFGNRRLGEDAWISARHSARRSSSPQAERKPTIPRFSAALEAADGRNEIVVSAVEHPAVLALCSHLERTRGVKVHRIPVDALGRLDRGRYRAALSRKRRARVDHVGQQRDRRCVPDRGAGGGGQVGRRAVPHRRRPGGRAPADRLTRNRDRHAVAIGPQAARSQGRRRALRAARRSVRAADPRRQAGARPARRHRETSRASSASARRPKWPTPALRGDAARMRALRDRLES